MKTTRHADIAPGVYNWITAGSGMRGLPFVYAIRKRRAKSSCTSTAARAKRRRTRRILVGFQHKTEIEQAFGAELSWERLDEKRACRIAYHMTGGG